MLEGNHGRRDFEKSDRLQYCRVPQAGGTDPGGTGGKTELFRQGRLQMGAGRIRAGCDDAGAAGRAVPDTGGGTAGRPQRPAGKPRHAGKSHDAGVRKGAQAQGQQECDISAVVHAGVVHCAADIRHHVLVQGRGALQLACLFLRRTHQRHRDAEPAVGVARFPEKPAADLRHRVGIPDRHSCFRAADFPVQFLENLPSGHSGADRHFPVVPDVPPGERESGGYGQWIRRNCAAGFGRKNGR